MDSLAFMEKFSTAELELAGVQPSWGSRVLCPDLGLRPRQFEYDPKVPGRMVFGTILGSAVTCNHQSGTVIRRYETGISDATEGASADAILGLCWLRRADNKFLAGSSSGVLSCCSATATEESTHETRAADATATAASPLRVGGLKGVLNAVRGGSPNSRGFADGSSSSALPDGVLGRYPPFEKLTSVHVNSDDTRIVTCGYKNSVRLYDLETAKVLTDMDSIHETHINISRFAHHSPHILATCSFDKTVKMWDLRVPKAAGNVYQPLYTLRSHSGHVMLCWSPDDVHLLTSAVDNEVRQYTALDGRQHLKLPIPRLHHRDNYTRAYYSASGRFILSGSSEEQCIRLHCSSTGSHLQSAELYSGRRHHSAYVQSLRGDPHCETKFSVLVSYRDTAYPLEIVAVDMLKLGNQSADRDPGDGRSSHGTGSSDNSGVGSRSCGKSEAIGEVTVEPAVPPPSINGTAPAPLPRAPPSTPPPLSPPPPPMSSSSSSCTEFHSVPGTTEVFDGKATATPKAGNDHESNAGYDVSNSKNGENKTDDDGSEGAGLGDSWFVVGRPSPLLLEGLRGALLGDDTDQLRGVADVRLICSHEYSEKDGSPAQEAVAEATKTTMTTSRTFFAHAAVLAARSSVLRRELEARRNTRRTSFVAATPQIMATEESDSPSREMPASTCDTTSGDDATAATVVDEFQLPFSAPLLEVVLEYLYLDRLTLVCDRAVRPDSSWLARPDLSKFASHSRANRNSEGATGAAAGSGYGNGTIGGAEVAEGRADDANGDRISERQRSSSSDSSSDEDYEDGGSNFDGSTGHNASPLSDDDSDHGNNNNYRNNGGLNRQRLVQEWQRECLNWQQVLEECSTVLDAAKALDLGHLASLCLARLKRLLEPSTVAAVAACARRAHDAPPLQITFRDDSNNSIASKTVGTSSSLSPIGNVAAAPASDLISFCAHYLVSHLDIALISQQRSLSEKKSTNCTGNETSTNQGSDNAAAKTTLNEDEEIIPDESGTPALNGSLPYGVSAATLIASGAQSLSSGGWLLCATLNRRSQAAQVVEPPKSRRASIEPLATPLVPACNGHTCTPVLGNDRVLVLGGGNHGAFHSLRDLMMWHAPSATWVKLQTRLAPGCKMPSSALYHSVTPLEEPLHHDGSSTGSSTIRKGRGAVSDNSFGCGGGTRRVLMFGGILGDVPGVARASHHEYRPPPPHLFVLDLPNLRWCTPHVNPDCCASTAPWEPSLPGSLPEGKPCSRIRHTMVALWPTTSSPNSSTSNCNSGSTRSGADGGGFVENCKASDDEVNGVKHVSTLVLFGGYYPDLRIALNDLWCLDVKQKNQSSCTNDESSSCSSNCSSSSSRSEQWNHGEGFVRGSRNNGRVLSEVSGTVEVREDEYTYAWRRARVGGTVPETRLAHSATMIPPFKRALNSTASEETSSSISNSAGPWMVVFGGVGIGAVFGDVCLLNCANAMTNAASSSSLNAPACAGTGRFDGSNLVSIRGSSSEGAAADLVWENVQIRGASPSPRYGHTMSLLSAHRASKLSNSEVNRGSLTGSHSSGTEACATLVVFGGTTGEECFNDLWLLDCDLEAHVVSWSRPKLHNDPSNTTLPAQSLPMPPPPMGEDQEQLAEQGSRQQEPVGGEESTSTRAAVEEADVSSRAAGLPSLVPTLPSPRSRHQMVALSCGDADNESNGGMAEIFLFGGSNDVVDRQVLQNDKIPPADNSVYILRVLNSSPTTTTAAVTSSTEPTKSTTVESSTWKEHNSPDAATRHQDETKGEVQAEDTEALPLAWHAVKPAKVLAAGSEPSLAWSPSTLLSDLVSLVDEPVFADVSFAFEPPLPPVEPHAPSVSAGASAVGDENDGRQAHSTDEFQNPLAAQAADSSAWLPSEPFGEHLPPKQPKIYGEDSDSSGNDDDGHDQSSAYLPQTSFYGEAPAPLPPLLAHRVLLTLRDDPIAVMLRSTMREGRSGEIVLPGDVERSAFSAVLAFLYTDALFFPSCRSLPRRVTTDAGGGDSHSPAGKRNRTGHAPSPELVLSTLYLGQQYCLPRLVALCEGLLLRVCDCGANAAALLDFAHLVGLPRLAAAVRSHAFRSPPNWDALQSSEGWRALAPEVQAELCKARIHSGHLYVNDVPDHELRKHRGQQQQEGEQNGQEQDGQGNSQSSSSSSSRRRRFDPTSSFRGFWTRLSNSER